MKRIMVIALLLPVLCRAQNIAQNADSLLTAYTQQNKFSGNVLIAKAGKIVFEKAYGMADREAQSPNTLQTEFRAGSLTKMFTSTAILQLAEAGRLSLTDAVSKYVPQLPYGDQIQIQHLLSHTSGIHGHTEGATPTTLAQSVAQFKVDTLSFTPGARFEYNNFNFILLSYIAEKVTGTPFPQLLSQQVFAKAGMQHSGLDVEGRQSASKAIGYITNPQTVAWVPAGGRNVATASGAGALYTTLHDLYQWAKVAAAGVVMKKESYAKATTPVQAGYGLGWMVENKNGRTAFGHTGAIEGYIASFFTYPKEEVTIVMLCNYGDAAGRQLLEGLTAVAFGEPFTLPKVKKELAMTNEALQKYAGQYKLNENFVVTVSVENNKLYALAPGDVEKIEFTPESETKFFLKGPETEVEFSIEAGVVKSLFINMQGGLKLVKIS